MTQYTDEADQAITAVQRTVLPGDQVTHEDATMVLLGRVCFVEEGNVSVLWEGSDTPTPVAADRVHFLERPDSFACVTFEGHDDVSDTPMKYTLMCLGSPDTIREDLEVYGKIPGYTVHSSRVDGSDNTP